MMRKGNRFLTATAMTSIAALALAGCAQSSNSTAGSPNSTAGSSAGAGGKDLTVFISGDTNVQLLWEQDLIPAFEKDNPGYTAIVELDLHGLHDSQTVAKLTSATQQNKDPGFDLVDGGFISQIAAAGLLTNVSTSNLSGLADVPEDVVKAGGNGGIPYRASSVLLTYNSKTVSTPPTTLDDLLAWIKANPGQFTYNTPDSGGSGQAFVTTVLDKYVPAADRQKMVVGYDKSLESDWDQGFQTLASLNPYTYQKGVYPNGNNQVLALLSSGQISMAPVWSDQFITGQKNGSIPAYVKYTQISNPSFTGGAAYLGIPKTSTKQDAALKLANWLLTPKAQELVAGGIGGFPVISLSKLSSGVQDQFKSADINNLRPTYFNSMTKDLNNLWAQKVPGK
jgi:putative spermidine/putrescine transport system substrate-binding protein